MMTKKEIKYFIIAIVVWLALFGFRVYRRYDLRKEYTTHRFDRSKEVPALFSMKELGYDESIIENSNIKTVKLKDGTTIEYYDLSLDAVFEERSVFLKFKICPTVSNEDAILRLKEAIVFYQENINESTCVNGNCYVPNVTFENVVKEWYKLDTEIWPIDFGYSIQDYQNVPADYMGWFDLFLAKDHQMMHVQIDKDIEMSDQNIQIICDIFNRTSEVFEKEDQTNQK